MNRFNRFTEPPYEMSINARAIPGFKRYCAETKQDRRQAMDTFSFLHAANVKNILAQAGEEQTDNYGLFCTAIPETDLYVVDCFPPLDSSGKRMTAIMTTVEARRFTEGFVSHILDYEAWKQGQDNDQQKPLLH